MIVMTKEKALGKETQPLEKVVSKFTKLRERQFREILKHYKEGTTEGVVIDWLWKRRLIRYER